MVLVDRMLDERRREGRPILVGMIGAGFMGRGIALQIVTAVPGIRLAAISNRTIEAARRAYVDAGAAEPRVVRSAPELDEAIARGVPAVSCDPTVLCESEQLEAIIEVTGAVEFGASVVLRAIERHKHVITMNAELDATVGPILKVLADRAGVVLTGADGDQPGVIMNLYRFVRHIGVCPVLCGNIKGLHDRTRNPTTQEAFARRWGQDVNMVTSFADGTKISFEQAIVANATGMRVARRGMHGPTVESGTPIDRAADWYPADDLLAGTGIVDYVVGAAPNPGVFILGTHDHPVQRHYLNLYKLGPGPFYCFYTPYHLCHFEVPTTVARAVLFGDAAIAPLGPPLVEVVATAKVDLVPGQVLDGPGGYATYGQCENADISAAERLLPMGLAEGCTVTRAIPRDAVLTYDDVLIPAGRCVDRLRQQQSAFFAEHGSVPAGPGGR